VSFISRNSKPPAGTETPVVGTVKLKQSGFGYPTFMDVQISGLPPNTTHGFHVHQYGNTVTDGCQSTGGHYNPFGKTHGAPTSPIRHVGDLGNLVSDDQGQVNVKIEDHLVSLVGPYSIIGRAFVIHQKRDDLGQGTGEAKPGMRARAWDAVLSSTHLQINQSGLSNYHLATHDCYQIDQTKEADMALNTTLQNQIKDKG